MGSGRFATVTLALALWAWPAAPAAAQPHVTPWGDPDLQGAWTNATTTPLQRPAELALRESFTEEERAELDAQRALTEQRACATELVVLQTAPPPTSTGSYNSFWLEQGTRTLQTSLIVDPPHGRLPELTPWAQRQADDLVAVRSSPSYPTIWEEPSVFERCITRGLPATMMPGFYNHNYQILQTPDHVVIYAEMIHDARVIPLDGRPHRGRFSSGSGWATRAGAGRATRSWWRPRISPARYTSGGCRTPFSAPAARCRSSNVSAGWTATRSTTGSP